MHIFNKLKMDTGCWIQCFLYGLLLLNHSTYGEQEVLAKLKLKNYMEKGGSVTLLCEHNVETEILYKITFLKSNYGKFYQFINGRVPPIRHFDVPGAVIDLNESSNNAVTLKNLDLDATGQYFCEVSTDSPIFTRESDPEVLHVVLQQSAPPKIIFNKPKFTFGDLLLANCSTSRARPPPHITWLINGKKVDDKHTKTLHYGVASANKNVYRPKTHSPVNHHERIMESNNAGSGSGGGSGNGGHGSGVTHMKSTNYGREPFDSNRNHMGFETYPNSGYSNSNRNNNNNNNNHNYYSTSQNNNKNYNNVFDTFSGSGSDGLQPSTDYYNDDKHSDSNIRKHR